MQLSRILKQHNPCFTSLSADTTLDQALIALALHGKTAVVVLDGAIIKGILTRTDMVKALQRGDYAPSGEKTIAQMMTRELVISDPQSTFDHALERMAQSNIEHLPVIDEGRLLTVIHERDLLRSRIKALEADNEQLREYIDNLHNANQD
jgi:CBS domain-containing protein